MKCSDPACRENLIKSIEDKVKKSTLMWAVIVLVGLVGGTSTLIYTAYSRGQDRQQKQTEQTVDKIDKRIKENADHIQQLTIEAAKNELRFKQILKEIKKLNHHNEPDT